MEYESDEYYIKTGEEGNEDWYTNPEGVDEDDLTPEIEELLTEARERVYLAEKKRKAKIEAEKVKKERIQAAEQRKKRELAQLAELKDKYPDA